MKMLPNQSFSRIDTLELKSMIVRKIGHERAEKYFELIRRLFSLKISKCEFNKFCIRIIGRDNLPLHNRLIRSIIKNAHLAKAPPLPSFRKPGSTLTVNVGNEYKRNGDAIPQSPLTGRSAVDGDNKFPDRPSPLGPNGKPQGVAYQESVSKAQVHQNATELPSLGSRPPIEVASVEDGEEVEQAAGSPSIQSRSPVTAPFGISMNLGGSRKFLRSASVCHTYHLETCQNCGELPDTRSLRSCLERKLRMEGINASVDCVNLLNNGLDTYLKRLIEPCIRFAGMRQRESTCATMLDFRASVELNPQILGEDWGIQLEKIVLRASED